MANTKQRGCGVTEYCPGCGRETKHQVSIALVAESDDEETAPYSREPYRLTTCRECGVEHRQRMNTV